MCTLVSRFFAAAPGAVRRHCHRSHRLDRLRQHHMARRNLPLNGEEHLNRVPGVLALHGLLRMRLTFLSMLLRTIATLRRWLRAQTAGRYRPAAARALLCQGPSYRVPAAQLAADRAWVALYRRQAHRRRLRLADRHRHRMRLRKACSLRLKRIKCVTSCAMSTSTGAKCLRALLRCQQAQARSATCPAQACQT